MVSHQTSKQEKAETETETVQRNCPTKGTVNFRLPFVVHGRLCFSSLLTQGRGEERFREEGEIAEKKWGDGRNNLKMIGRREKQRVKGEGRNRRFWLKIITNFSDFQARFQ